MKHMLKQCQMEFTYILYSLSKVVQCRIKAESQKSIIKSIINMTCTGKRSNQQFNQVFPGYSLCCLIFCGSILSAYYPRSMLEARMLQIEYLQETKHASDTLLRALLFRKFVFIRTRISVRKRPSWKRDKIAS